ncbi:hypothetical protein [Kineococcus terrestris]|uniref:hypothetical protein n=1 Tax=Kineococcus terrestris TaxID=2044856 RepID=UPI0034DAF76B
MLARRTVVQTAAATAAAATATAVGPAPAAAAPADRDRGRGRRPLTGPDRAFVDRLRAAAALQVDTVLAAYPDQAAGLWQNRALARSLRRLVAVHADPGAARYRDRALLPHLDALVAALRATQHADGLWSQGNLHTPPDSAFVVNDLCKVLALLEADADPAAAGVREGVRTLLRAVGPALAAGGVHTPNHRWEICSALARLDALLPDPAHARRIGEWLAEGIDVDEDGQYSERSVIYTFVVVNPALQVLARLTGRTQLLATVRRSLDAQLLLLEDDGTVETVHSRRQDQKGRQDVAEGVLVWREAALADRDGRCAAVVRRIDERTDDLARSFDGDAWADVLLHPELARRLPPSAPLGTDGEHVLAASGLARLRAGTATASVFAGTDGGEDPDRPGPIASGLSTNPTFLRWRRGAAVLSSVRLAPRFFSTGHFRADGLDPRGGGAYRLHQRITAGYWQPLAPADRRPDGDYDLTPDGRFWAAMSFDRRPREARVLETTLDLRAVDGDVRSGFDLTFAVSGTEGEGEVPAVVELTFAGDGELTGTEELEDGAHQLVEGYGTWTCGGDAIRFGPGTGSGPRQPASVDPGERYTWLGGDLVPEGTRVLLTTTVPRSWTLQLR